MKAKFSRGQILDLLGKKIKARKPIFVANASAGMIAKYAEKNSADARRASDEAWHGL